MYSDRAETGSLTVFTTPERALSDSSARQFNRRQVLRFGAASVLAALVVACTDDDPVPVRDEDAASEGTPSTRVRGEATGSPTIRDATDNATASAAGRLTARPGNTIPLAQVNPGLQTLSIGNEGDVLLYIPQRYAHNEPSALAIMLLGAGGDARRGINSFLGSADDANVILVATTSRDRSWDIVMSGEFGADIAMLDLVLADTFRRFTIDPEKIAIAGFSDGASYALSVGITNGDLFGAIMAFSPGFSAPDEPHGKPRIFVSHGTQDATLPIDLTSRQIVPQLQQAGYAVEYIEFDGPHAVLPEEVSAALDWWLHDD